MKRIGRGLLRGAASDRFNMKGAYYEVRSEILTSVGVIVAGLIMMPIAWYYADPWVATGSGLAILPRIWRLLPLHEDRGAAVRVTVAGTVTESLTGARAAGGTPRERRAAERALELLAWDTTHEPRAAVLCGPARTMTRRAIPAVTEAARDPSPVLRALAAGGLGRTLNDAAVGDAAMASLVELVTDRLTAVRLTALQALGTHATSRALAVDAELRAASHDTKALVRREALHALSRFHARGGGSGRARAHARRTLRAAPSAASRVLSPRAASGVTLRAARRTHAAGHVRRHRL